MTSTTDDAPVEDPPETPAKLPRRSWVKVFRGAMKEFSADNLSDTAAALTYYSVQAIFPAAIVVLSLIGLAGKNTTNKLIANLGPVIPQSAHTQLVSLITSLQKSHSSAGIALILGLVTGVWSASGYVAAFMRAANVVFDVPEGRPVWKTIPTRLATTIVLLILMFAAAVIVVFTGPVAKQAGDLLGLGSAAVTTWDIAKWPVLIILLMIMVAILYWATPNAKQGFAWVSPGGVVGVLIWVIASGLFAFYVANFSSYSKTYGTMAGIIIFLVWVWISNLAILLGLEFNAELNRARAEADGLPEGAEPYVELRDTRKLDDDQKAEVERSHLHEG